MTAHSLDAWVAHVAHVRALLLEDAAWRADLAASLGLTLSEVTRAVRDHLESAPTASERASMLAAAIPSKHALVVLSANVFVASHRALALALAGLHSGGTLQVKLSRREPGFAAGLLGHAIIPDVELLVREDFQACNLDLDAAYLYGSDATLATLRDRLLAAKATGRTLMIGAHGAGLGLAWAHRRPSPDELGALAHDVAAFRQQGCLSPRLVAYEGTLHEAQHGANQLLGAMEEVRAELGVTALPRSQADQYANMLGQFLRKGASRILLLDQDARCPLLEPGYALVLLYGDRASLLARLASMQASITCVGVQMHEDDELRADLASAFSRARYTQWGKMQKPLFDGPVDQRTTPICYP
jgi:Acyl-CoA reductase (LuxC)